MADNKPPDLPPDVRPIDASELQRRAVAGAVWTVIALFVNLPVAFVANAVVARSLGVVHYGNLAFLAAALGLAVTFSNFGFSTALVQAGSRAEASGRRSEGDELLRRSLGFNAIVQLPILIVVAVVLTRGDPWWEIAAVGAAVLGTCLLSGAALGVTIENRTAAAARLATAANLILQAASVSTALLTGSASAVWAIRTVIPALALGLNFFLLDRRRRRVTLRPRLPLKLGAAFWRYSLLSWGSGLLGLLVYSRSEIFLLQAFHNTEALGLFALAYGLSQVITAPADAMLHSLIPAVAGVLSSWPARADATFDRSTRVSALLCGGVSAVVIPTLVFAIPLVYGRTFTTAGWLFVPLAFVSVFQSLNNPVVAFVNGRQQGGLILRATAAALVVDVVIAIALIPLFGAWGAVAANVGGQLVSLIWLAATEPLVRRLGLAGLLRLYRAFLAGVAIGGLVLATGSAFAPSSIPATCIAAFVVGSLAYVVAVRLTRSGLTLHDRDAVVGAMAVSMRPYVSRLLLAVTAPNADLHSSSRDR